MRDGSIIGPIIIAIGVIVAAISFALVQAVLDRAEGTTELRIERLEAYLADLSRTLEDTREELRIARADSRRILNDMARIAAAAPSLAGGGVSPPVIGDDLGSNAPAETENMTEVMRLARERYNTGLLQPNNRVMLDILGRPRESFSQDCQTVTNPRIRALLETRNVGPIQVTMIRPALDSLERIMRRLEEREPDIYNAIGTAGALCARYIRGSSTGISNHSWGTAVDITLQGRLDGFADGGTQFGLLLLAEAFNEEGWYWGATYGREDSMHFEVGAEALRAWEAQGLLDP